MSSTDIRFLNLIVKKILPSSAKLFIKSWLQQIFKDFKIIFIKKDLDEDQEKKLNYIVGFSEAVGFRDKIEIVIDEKDISKAKVTREIEDTNELPVDKFELCRLKANYKEVLEKPIPEQIQSKEENQSNISSKNNEKLDVLISLKKEENKKISLVEEKPKTLQKKKKLTFLEKKAKYFCQKNSSVLNTIHVLLVNFGDTTSYTHQAINDLIVQNSDFDLTIVDNGSDDFQKNSKYLKLLFNNWNFKTRSLRIIGLEKEIALNTIWNEFKSMTKNPWLCFLNNDVCIPENFISDNIDVIHKEKNAGIINHATNNQEFKTSKQLKYKIYDPSSNKFYHRQGWDFTIDRNLFVTIPPEFTTYVGDNIQFNNVYQSKRDVIFIYSSPIIHYCSSSIKKKIDHYSKILKNEHKLYISDEKYKKYGNWRKYSFDRSLSIAKPEDINELKKNIYLTDKKIIVSLTTWKKRIQNIPKVLKSILDQTIKPDEIVINLAKEEFKNQRNDISKDILDFIDQNNIRINWVEKDTKVYKKIIPTLLQNRNDLILSIDDDFIYPKTMINDFYLTYCQHPNQPVSGNRITKFNLDCHCGCASLVQYKFYNVFLNNYLEYYENCKSSDIVFTYIANMNGYQYARTDKMYFNNMEKISGDKNVAYSLSNSKHSKNMIEETYIWLEKKYE